MAIDTTYFDSDLDGMIADMPAVASYGGSTFNVSIAELAVAHDLVLVGEVEDAAFECTFPAAALSPAIAPVPSTRFDVQFPTTAFTRYKVQSVGRSADGIAHHLVLRADKRN